MQRTLYTCFFALMLLASCAPSAQQENSVSSNLQKSVYHARFEQNALQQVRWLQGAWKSTAAGQTLEQSIRFMSDQSLEITAIEGAAKTSLHFSWENGHFYYGDNHQWMVTWISDKNIHFDPLMPGLKPMTWSRVSDNTWHLIRHDDHGDETIEMARNGELPS